MRMQTAVAAATFVAWLMPHGASAQEAAAATQPPAPQPPAAQAAGKPAGLGSWWEKSSLAYEPMPEQLLFHMTSDLSFTDARGNTFREVVTLNTYATYEAALQAAAGSTTAPTMIVGLDPWQTAFPLARLASFVERHAVPRMARFCDESLHGSQIQSDRLMHIRLRVRTHQQGFESCAIQPAALHQITDHRFSGLHDRCQGVTFHGHV